MKGVKIFLESGVRIPKWIRNQCLNVKVAKESIKSRNIRILTIKKGKASFGPGGVVGIVMPGSDQWWTAFNERYVLKIQNLEDKTTQKNFYFCEECFRVSGEQSKAVKHISTLGLPEATISVKCNLCGHEWDYPSK